MPTATEQVRAAFAERLSGFPLVTGATRIPRPLADQIAWRGAATSGDAWLTQVDKKQAPRRFTGEPQTGFGALL
jgi:hypothetical protein